MKKLIVLMISLLMVSLVFGQVGIGQTALDKAQERGTPKGLQVALTKVTNENARLRIEANIAKMEEKQQEIVAKLQELRVEEVNGDLQFKGTRLERVKWINIPFIRSVQFNFVSQRLERNPRFMDFLFQEQEEVVTEG